MRKFQVLFLFLFFFFKIIFGQLTKRNTILLKFPRNDSRFSFALVFLNLFFGPFVGGDEGNANDFDDRMEMVRDGNAKRAQSHSKLSFPNGDVLAFLDYFLIAFCFCLKIRVSHHDTCMAEVNSKETPQEFELASYCHLATRNEFKLSHLVTTNGNLSSFFYSYHC